jgi:hypothetical protein
MIGRKQLRMVVLVGIVAASAASIAAIGAPPADRPPANSCAIDVRPSSGNEPMWLDIVVRCAIPGPLTLRANARQSAGFVARVGDAAGHEVAGDGRAWTLPASPSGVVEARYRFELDAYLDQTDSETVGMRRGGTRALLLEGWLMQPLANDKYLPVAIAVDLAPGENFASGLRREQGRYVLDDMPIRFAGYSVFGRFQPLVVPVPAPPGSTPDRQKIAHIDLVMLDADYAVSRRQYADWVGQSAQAIATDFDGFSSQQTLIVVFPARGKGIRFGRVVPGGGVTMILRAGIGEKASDLYGEWVLIHEMIHTAAPFVDGNGTWLMEGMATYIEPIIRSRVGWKSEDDVWREWLANMPRGVGALSESGLLANTTRAGYYWGGALFMLLSDVGMRQASNNKYGLEDCLRTVLKDVGNAAKRVGVDQMIDACDKAVGGNTMRDLARRFVYKATPFDLLALWRDLGVELVDGQVVYHDDAPLAAVRKVIVRGTRGPSLVPMGPA